MARRPRLSPETRRELDAELAEIAQTPHDEGTSDEIPAPAPVRRAGAFAEHRGIIAGTFLLALVVGGVAALAIGDWWIVFVPLVLHAVATICVLVLVAGILSESEHASPELAADLKAEGVSAPDRLLTDLADEQREDPKT